MTNRAIFFSTLILLTIIRTVGADGSDDKPSSIWGKENKMRSLNVRFRDLILALPRGNRPIHFRNVTSYTERYGILCGGAGEPGAHLPPLLWQAFAGIQTTFFPGILQ